MMVFLSLSFSRWHGIFNDIKDDIEDLFHIGYVKFPTTISKHYLSLVTPIFTNINRYRWQMIYENNV